MTYGARAAAPATTRSSASAASSACRPSSGPPSSASPKHVSDATTAAGTASEEEVEREPVGARAVGESHEDDRAERKETAKHPPRFSWPGLRSPPLRFPRMAGTLTWLGHSSFRLNSPSGKRIYVDPWLGNPKCPDAEREPERVHLIALTHGHFDHVGETVELWQKFSPPVIALVELRRWLSQQGVVEDMASAANKGGTVNVDGIKITLTDAKHSSSGPGWKLPG